MSCETQNVNLVFNDDTNVGLIFDDDQAVSLTFNDDQNVALQCDKFASVAAPDYYTDTVVATLGSGNIVAHYKLNESSGTNAADETGTNDGTYTNGPTLGATSLVASGGGTAVDFDGTNDYVNLTQNTNFDFIQTTGVFTVAAWVEFPADGAFRTIIANSFSNTIDGFYMRQTSSNEIAVAVNGAATLRVVTGAVRTAGTYHVCMTGDGTDLTLYVNGSSDGTPISISPGGGASSEQTWIGGYSGTSGFFWNGRIDEVTIADTTASAANVLALYNGGI